MNARIVLVVMALLPGVLVAQQAPNHLPSPSDPRVTPSSPAQPFHAVDVGDTTRYLLELQAEGGQAGKSLPMIGDEATASYRRYLKSFDNPIPEFYSTTVGKTDDSGR